MRDLTIHFLAGNGVRTFKVVTRYTSSNEIACPYFQDKKCSPDCAACQTGQGEESDSVKCLNGNFCIGRIKE